MEKSKVVQADNGREFARTYIIVKKIHQLWFHFFNVSVVAHSSSALTIFSSTSTYKLIFTVTQHLDWTGHRSGLNCNRNQVPFILFRCLPNLDKVHEIDVPRIWETFNWSAVELIWLYWMPVTSKKFTGCVKRVISTGSVWMEYVELNLYTLKIF